LIRIFFSLMFLIFFKAVFLFSLFFAFVHDLLMKLVNQEVKDSDEDYLNARKSLNNSNLFQLLSILFYSRYLYKNQEISEIIPFHHNQRFWVLVEVTI